MFWKQGRPPLRAGDVLGSFFLWSMMVENAGNEVSSFPCYTGTLDNICWPEIYKYFFFPPQISEINVNNPAIL